MGKASPQAAVVLDARALIAFERGDQRMRTLVKGPTTSVPFLDQVLAEAAGVLCGRAGTSDVIDASVVLVARRERAVVVTSDLDDLRSLDPTLRIELACEVRA